MDDLYYRATREAARQLYDAQPVIYSPFFKGDILLGSEGFRHLRVSAQGERTKEEQVKRFELLPTALQSLTTATTLQRYRKRPSKLHLQRKTGALKERKIVQWWCFMALFPNRAVRVQVVVRKVGDGKLHFWSVAGKKTGDGREPKYSAEAGWTSN